MDRCEETVIKTSRNILCWLHSRRAESCYPKPFTLVSRTSSKRKYYRLFKWFIALVAGITFKRRQLWYLNRIWHYAAQAISRRDVTGSEVDISSEGEEGEDSESDYSGDDDDSSDGDEDGDSDYEERQGTCSGEVDSAGGGVGRETCELLGGQADSDNLLELLFGLSIEFTMERLLDSQPSSTLLVYFSGILSFSPASGTFIPARTYTPHLSGLIYAQRLLLLKSALSLRGPQRELLQWLEHVRQRYVVTGAQSALDESILRWLESLAIPRHFGQGGSCSTCSHGWVVEHDLTLGPDGRCENRPVVRRMVAALCAYDDQMLSKILTKIALKRDGFEQRIRSLKGFWVPRLLHVLDELILAFNFQHPERQALGEPVIELDWGPARWDNELEVQDWKTALDWWEERCSFCAGRRLRDGEILYTLRECKRGGAAQVRKGLGEMFYKEGYLPFNGCEICYLPRDFCTKWKLNKEGKWVKDRFLWARCRYKKHLLCNSVLRFATCGVRRYEDDIIKALEGYYETMSLRVSYNKETAAI
ncbi:hypothetical protein QBC46DRAFT_365102 [Diplogelasinospora grovesii]|uniref:Uncharacterized protein n=1 Tax=Diplogelasinospora grovesii TaxID=303347 RepID=A0AAN6N568_9PEZI|nr:hypothetical protein QBC46DRAFT_365102 [Diplogelasinospora grovesii]